jgi:uncharacterized membrane protein YbhN (UPF0104 family)
MAATAAFLVYYWRSHPEITSQLAAVSPWAVGAIIALHLLTILVLVMVYDTILRMCGRTIGLGEHTLLTMYSSIVNFFGPLQSGPGVRTVYLKQKHGVPMKAYLGNTLAYYALFGFISLLFLAAAAVPLPALPVLVLMAIAGVYLARPLAARLPLPSRLRTALSSRHLPRLAGFTLLQLLLVVIIYYIELHAVGVNIGILQAVAYAGAGSLAIFVSLTPGALGFRESFQYLTQDIHRLDSGVIVTANLLDRSAYVAVLGIVFVIILVFHARSRFRV